MKKNFLLIIICLLLVVKGSSQKPDTCSLNSADAYFGQTPPDASPVKFLPDILTAEKYPHGQLAFSPNNKLLLWSAMLAKGPEQTIFYSTYSNRAVSKPEIASFASGKGNGGPAFSYDGNRVFFSAELPPIENSTKKPFAIDYVDKTSTGWGNTVIIDITADTLMTKGQVSVARNGNLYFSGRIYTETAPGIYMCQYLDGNYLKPEKIKGPLADTPLLVDPWIDPDERFMLFSFPSEQGPPMLTDIGISFPDKNGEWGSPVRLNKEINTEAFERFPALSGDEKYLFFIRSLNQKQFVSDQAHFYWVSAGCIEELRPAE